MAALHAHDRLGTEPRNARSPLRLRYTLATTAAALSILGAVLLAVVSFAAQTGDDRSALRVTSLICGIVAVISVTDALIVRRRIRRGDTG